MANVRRTLWRAANAVNSSLHRASGDRLMGKVRGMPVLLITVAGRNTGTIHINPVSYLEDDGRYVVTGSGGGSAAEPQWFKNLRRTDEAEIEIGRRKLAVGVSVAAGEQRDILWKKLVARVPFFADYQRKIERQIPMAILMPKTWALPIVTRSARSFAFFRTRSCMRPDSGGISLFVALCAQMHDE